MTRKTREWLGAMVALAGGAFTGWVDNSLLWRDTARVGFCLVVFAAVSVFIARRRPWLLAILVAIWVPVLPLDAILNWKPWLAFLPAFIAAYITYLATERSDLVL